MTNLLNIFKSYLVEEVVYSFIKANMKIAKFKRKILKSYGFCLSHYLIVPALNWDAMLSMTKINFEIFRCRHVLIL